MCIKRLLLFFPVHQYDCVKVYLSATVWGCCCIKFFAQYRICNLRPIPSPIKWMFTLLTNNKEAQVYVQSVLFFFADRVMLFFNYLIECCSWVFFSYRAWFSIQFCSDMLFANHGSRFSYICHASGNMLCTLHPGCNSKHLLNILKWLQL